MLGEILFSQTGYTSLRMIATTIIWRLTQPTEIPTLSSKQLAKRCCYRLIILRRSLLEIYDF